jgi:hypothetical protein
MYPYNYYYVDCNGDLWVPCFCGGSCTGTTGATGSMPNAGNTGEAETTGTTSTAAG